MEFPGRATRLVPLARVFWAPRLVLLARAVAVERAAASVEIEGPADSENRDEGCAGDPKVKVLRTGGLKAWSCGSSLRSLANDS